MLPLLELLTYDDVLKKKKDLVIVMKTSNKCRITPVIGRKVQSAVTVDIKVTQSNPDGKSTYDENQGEKIQSVPPLYKFTFHLVKAKIILLFYGISGVL